MTDVLHWLDTPVGSGFFNLLLVMLLPAFVLNQLANGVGAACYLKRKVWGPPLAVEEELARRVAVILARNAKHSQGHAGPGPVVDKGLSDRLAGVA